MSWKRFSGPDVGDTPTPTRSMAADAFTGIPFKELGFDRPRTRTRYRRRYNGGAWTEWINTSEPTDLVLPDGVFAGDTAESEVEVFSGQPWRLSVNYVTTDDDGEVVSESVETEVFVPGNTYTLENTRSSTPLGLGTRGYSNVMVDVPGPPP